MSLILDVNNHVLRKQLAEIIKPAYTAAELKAQIRQMADLAITHPHNVSLIAENVPGTRPFNCYQYSFEIDDVRVRDGIFKIFPGRDFAQFLVEHHLEEIEPGDAEDGDHILYSVVQVAHAGRVRSGAIESKWGTGHIWRHGVYEVPNDYGDTVRLYRHFSPESVLQILREIGFQIRT